MTTEPTPCPFPSTHWTLVAGAGADDTERLRVLGQLLERYLPAMRSYLAARFRSDPGRVDDLLQGFLADKILEQDIVRRADQARGKFRTFLVTALGRYAVSRLRAEGAARRSPPGGLVPLDEAVLADRPAPGARDPFDGERVREAVELAVRRTKAECDAGGRQDVWCVFEARVLLPALGRAAPHALPDVSRRLGVTPARASNLLVTSKRMFARNLRKAVYEAVSGYEDPGDDIRRLKTLLAECRGGRNGTSP